MNVKICLYLRTLILSKDIVVKIMILILRNNAE